MLVAIDTLQPVVDRVGRDRGGQRSEGVWRRAGDGRELAETPVRQCGDATRCLAQREVVVDRFGPELAGDDGALFDPLAAGASGLEERVNAGEPFIGWARGPFPVR